MAPTICQTRYSDFATEAFFFAKNKINQNKMVAINLLQGTVSLLVASSTSVAQGLNGRTIQVLNETLPDMGVHYTTVHNRLNPSKIGSCIQITLNAARVMQIVYTISSGDVEPSVLIAYMADTLIHTANIVDGINKFSEVQKFEVKERIKKE